MFSDQISTVENVTNVESTNEDIDISATKLHDLSMELDDGESIEMKCMEHGGNSVSVPSKDTACEEQGVVQVTTLFTDDDLVKENSEVINTESKVVSVLTNINPEDHGGIGEEVSSIPNKTSLEHGAKLNVGMASMKHDGRDTGTALLLDSQVQCSRGGESAVAASIGRGAVRKIPTSKRKRIKKSSTHAKNKGLGRAEQFVEMDYMRHCSIDVTDRSVVDDADNYYTRASDITPAVSRARGPMRDATSIQSKRARDDVASKEHANFSKDVSIDTVDQVKLDTIAVVHDDTYYRLHALNVAIIDRYGQSTASNFSPKESKPVEEEEATPPSSPHRLEQHTEKQIVLNPSSNFGPRVVRDAAYYRVAKNVAANELRIQNEKQTAVKSDIDRIKNISRFNSTNVSGDPRDSRDIERYRLRSAELYPTTSYVPGVVHIDYNEEKLEDEIIPARPLRQHELAALYKSASRTKEYEMQQNDTLCRTNDDAVKKVRLQNTVCGKVNKTGRPINIRDVIKYNAYVTQPQSEDRVSLCKLSKWPSSREIARERTEFEDTMLNIYNPTYTRVEIPGYTMVRMNFLLVSFMLCMFIILMSLQYLEQKFSI